MKKKLKSNSLPSVFNGFFVWEHAATQVAFQYVSTGVVSDNNLHLFLSSNLLQFQEESFHTLWLQSGLNVQLSKS